MRTPARIVTLLLAVTLIVSACGRNTSSSSESSGGTGSSGGTRRVTMLEAGPINTLDPHLALFIPSYPWVISLFDRLVRFDQSNTLVGQLAESWSVSQDKLTWTFKLRKGVTFHDGTPFNAEAVKYSFDRIRDPATGSGRRSSFTIMKDIAAVDEITVAITTTVPYAPLLDTLAHPSAAILSPEAAKKVAVKDFGQQPVGSGPFKLKEWVSGDRIVLERFDGYWGEKAKINEMIARVVPDERTRALSIEKGEAEIARAFPPDEVKRFKESKDLDVLLHPSIVQLQLQLSNVMKPFDDKRVRQAASLAIDRVAICRDVMAGLCEPANSPQGPGQWAFETFAPPEHDVARAKQLLADAGYPGGIEFVASFPTGAYIKMEQVAEAMQAQLKQAGITMTIKFQEQEANTNAYSRVDCDKVPGPAWFSARGNPGTDFNLQRMYHSSNCMGKNSPTGYKNERVDKLFEQGQQEFDDAKREAIYREIQRIVWDDTPMLWLYSTPEMFGHRKSVKNLKLEANQYPLFMDVTLD